MKKIGESVYIDLMGRKNVSAKVDTGADTSAIWASEIRIDKDGVLKFQLFGKNSEHYSGKVIKRTDYRVTVVRSATGEEQIRYRTHLKVTLGGRRMKVLFNLSDRSRNNFPILVGKRTIRGKFVVDPKISLIKFPKIAATKSLVRELKKNPYEFHKKYVKNNGRRKA